MGFWNCKHCHGSGKVPDPYARWWQLWRFCRCVHCGGSGRLKPPPPSPSRLQPSPPPPPPKERLMQLLGPQKYMAIVESLKHLHDHDVQMILGACAIEILNRRDGAAAMIENDKLTACFAGGPARELLSEQWETWRREIELFVQEGE